MKTITLELPKRVINPQIKPGSLSGFELIKIALNQQPQGGLSTSEIRKRLKVFDKLESVKSLFEINGIAELALEDAEFETLKSCYKETTWAIAEPAITEFEDLLNSL